MANKLKKQSEDDNIIRNNKLQGIFQLLMLILVEGRIEDKYNREDNENKEFKVNFELKQNNNISKNLTVTVDSKPDQLEKSKMINLSEGELSVSIKTENKDNLKMLNKKKVRDSNNKEGDIVNENKKVI